MLKQLGILCGALVLVSCAQDQSARRDDLIIESQGYFFVGGEYRVAKDGHVMLGQMFVQYQIPRRRTSSYPIVMIHGGGLTGTNFLGTPDGREGWSDYFLRRGYAVYVVDAPTRGRSPSSHELLGAPARRSAEYVESLFSASGRKPLWPQAEKHTQWPGAGVRGDPVFDQFYAALIEQLTDPEVTERLAQTAGAGLLDRIGPAILLGHSQGGAHVWLIADARPKLVKAVVSLDPTGPPFHDVGLTGPPEWFKDGTLARPWGITRNPITYVPQTATPPQYVLEANADRPDLVRCRLQVEPARQLANLAGLPMLVVGAEASYHAPYDHCTSKYLTQAGVSHTYVRLEEQNIRGNGHLMMLEKNSDQIAAFIEQWLQRNVK